MSLNVAVYVPIPESWSKKKQAAAQAGEVAPDKRPDLDNFIKCALDGITGIVVRDDARVVSLEAMKAYDARPPGRR